MPLLIISIVAAALLLTALFLCFYSYTVTFKRSKKRPCGIPERPGYESYKKMLEEARDRIINTPYLEHNITAYDGVRLFGRFYNLYGDNAPIAIMMHGYHGSSARDFSGGFFIARDAGMNILLIDQRAHGKSGGQSITFGYKESRDAKSWCDYIASLYPLSDIVLLGVSMGASSVLLASTYELPENVCAAIADCPFDAAKNIIKKVISDIKLPVGIFYPFVYLGALLFARFDLNKASVFDNIHKCRLPVLIFHGDADSLVPYKMSEAIYEKIKTPKQIMIVRGAEHAMSCLQSPVEYRKTTNAFLNKVLRRDK